MDKSDRSLSVLLLGVPQITWQGERFDLKGRQNRLILYYLAANQKAVERRSLADLIWPIEEQTDIGRQLRQALSRLRRELPDRSLLIENRGQISLDPSRTYCDVIAFEQLLAESLRQAAEEQSSIPISKPDTVETMRRAIALWHGTKLMQTIDLSGSPGIEDWFIQLEHSLESGRRWLLERLSDHESARNRPIDALKLAQTALAGHELDENLHERVLKLLLRTGQRSQAKRHYTRMQKNFEKAGLEPNQALQTIAAQIEALAYKRTGAANTREGNRLPEISPEADSPWRVFHPGDEPFIGRMMILDTLRQVAQQGGGVLIEGESGQGKTRLLKEFYAHITPPPRLVIATCQPSESGLAFQPLINALNRQVTASEWFQLPATWASYLSLIFPELLSKRTGLRMPHKEDPTLMRSHLFRAISELLTLMAGRQPEKQLFLVVDDAHWADEATLQALAFLHNHPPFTQRGLILLAARVEEPNPALELLSSNLGKNERFKRLRMHNFSEPAVAQLVRYYTHQDPPMDFVHQLKKATGGNPLYLIETMRDRLQSGLTSSELVLTNADHPLPMPGRLLELMQYRLKRLTPEARRLINILAILGEDVEPHRLNRLAVRLSWPGIYTAMDHLVQSGLILRRGEAILDPGIAGRSSRYVFAHEKFREAALLSMSNTQKSLLHLQAAELLEEEAGHQINDQAAIIARHYEGGGDLPAAFHYWVWAVHQSERLAAFDTIIEQYEHANALLEVCNKDVSNDDIYLLYRSWTNSLNTANDGAGMEKLSERLQDFGARHNRPLLLGMSQHLKALAAFTRNEIETGLDLIQGYVGFLEQARQPTALAEAYTLNGVFLYMVGQISASLEYLYKSQELVQNRTAEDLTANDQVRINLYELSFAEIIGGNPAVGYEKALAGINYLESVNTPTAMTFCYSTAGLASHFMGELQRGLRHCQEGLDLAFRYNALRGIGYLSLYEAMCQIAMGDLDGGLANVQIADEFGRRYERREIYSFANRIRGDLFSQLGRVEEAAAFFRTALEENPDLFAAMDYEIRALTEELRLMGELESEAYPGMQQRVQRLKTRAQQIGLGLGVHYAARWEIVNYIRQKDWASVRQVLSAEEPALAAKNLKPMLMNLEVFAALAETAEGKLSQALERLEGVAAWSREACYVWLEIMAYREQIPIYRKLQQAIPKAVTERLTGLLKHLQEHGQHELIQEAVQQFCAKVESELQAAGG